jgi:hypothetical protein
MHRSKDTSCNTSFDHLVCASEQHRRHVDAQYLRGFQIDRQPVLGRRLYR